MRRHAETPRRDWRELVERAGLLWSDTGNEPYWIEDASYAFTLNEVLVLEEATRELHRRCLDAVQAVIDRGWWPRFGIAPGIAEAITREWNVEPPSIYGRFDLAYDHRHGTVKMLEYNADTPTALVEAAAVQWHWLQQVRPGCDQFNSIHERLVAKWRELRDHIIEPLYFTGLHDANHEDWMTLAYLQETAEQAGLTTQLIALDQIGLNDGCFVDEQDHPIRTIFKLYPWEWMLAEDFAPQAVSAPTQWIEPVWKMVLSNKAILSVLWELFPNHPNLLPCVDAQPAAFGDYVRKPKLAREGANVTVVKGQAVIDETGGEYGDGEFVYQMLAEVPTFSDARPILGSWVIDGEPAGIGIRETRGWVTDNRSRFVPHWIESIDR
jgi:glutathionylspermidine synthase